MRTATIERKTAETEIRLQLDLDGSGKASIHTGIGFLDHMLVLLTRHAMFDLTLQCRGDLQVDAHHSTEDIGICLGRALREAMGDKKGICRYGSITLPMDETLARWISQAAAHALRNWISPHRRSAILIPSWGRSFSSRSEEKRVSRCIFASSAERIHTTFWKHASKRLAVPCGRL